MDNNDSRKWLYESLKGKGYDLGSYDEFDSHADEADTRKWLYETARESGFDMGSYEDFDKGIGYRALRQEETISVNPQTIADTFSATKSEYPSLKEMATVSRFAPVDFSQKAEVDAMSPYSVESLGSRLQQLKKDGKLDMIIHQKEERELDRIYSPKKVENETDALENYRGRFRLTERGKFLNEELDGIRKEITDRYTNEYLASDRYKQLSSRYSGKQLNEEIDKDFQQQYGDRISKDMAPYMDAYNQQVFNRYDVGIQDDLTTLAKGRTINQVADLRRDIEQELEKTQPEINAPAGSAFIPSSAYGAAQRYGNVQSKEQQDRYTSLVAAKNLLDEADDIVNEASKKGNTTFLGGFSRGVRDKGFDVDTWAMGITDTAYGSLLRKAAQKSDRGEELSSEEKKLLEAAAVNMATQAYFASDLGRGYKAGGTSAQSIPFMLEFALNPVSGSGNAIAKGILKYGAKRFGLKALESSAVKNGLKVGSRLAGDAVAAAGMTATSGLGHVASGAQERMLGDVQFDFNEDGKIRYTGRDNQMSDGDAWLRSTLSNTLENQSEMVFNAFKGAGGVVGVPSTGSLFPGIERFSASKAGELYRAIKNNPTYRKLAERTQFHGMPEEYFEEVYNNLVSLPLGEGSWEESTDIDNNIDTFLGVAPTSIVMSMLGLGSVAKESYSTRRNRERFEKTLSQDELSFFKDLKQRIKDGNIEDAREVVKLTLNDKKLTSEQKKEKIRYVYDMLQENTIEAVRNAEAEDAIQKETDDIVNSSNQADGTVTECSRIATNEIGETVLVPGHIVGWMGGTVVENPDGTQSREGGHPIWQPIGSEERITLHEGEFDPESIKSMPVQDMMDATAEMMREEAQKKADMESKYDLSRISPPSGGITFTDISGRQITIVDKNPNDPGNGWIVKAPVLDEKGNPKKDEAGNMLEENFPITNEDYYDTMQAQLNAQEEVANIQDESSNLSENQVKDEILPPVGENIMSPYEVTDAIAEVNPTTEPIQEPNANILASESPVIYKKDKAGNDTDEVDFENMPIENSINYLNDLTGDIDATYKSVGKTLKKASEHLVSIQEKVSKIESEGVDYTDKKEVNAYNKAKLELAEAQKKVDYWNSIGEEIAASRVQPGDKTAEAILSMGEPMNGEELAAMMLGTGRLPILYDSYKKETGGRNTEARGMVGLFATKAKGGLSIEEAGELLMLADQENGTHFFDENDPNAGRNTIIDVLSGARTRGDLFGFIQRNREVMAERERQAELEAYEQTIARLAEASHMTPEEFIAFEENIAQMLEERLKDIPDEELKSIFAELYLDENYGRSRESDEVGTGVPEGEERAGSNEGSPGVLSEERGDNAGASEYSEERPELDDEIEQSGDGILLEADAVDGREEIKFTPPTQIGGENLLDYAARVVESKRVHDAGSEVDTHPTEAQKEAGNYKKGHVKIDGFDITIENPKGSVRSGVDADGKPWSVTMNNTYGYIRGTEGVDGDHIDVFLGDSGNKVYVVDQLNTETGAFDEHKVMYGFNSTEEATEAYLSNYSPGWQGLGAISEVSKESFRKWIDSSHRKTKPFNEYKSVREVVQSEVAQSLEQTEVVVTGNESETKDAKVFTVEDVDALRNNPLTIEEIKGSAVEPELKTLAMDYLAGNESFINLVAYQNIYNDVRNRTRGIEPNSTGAGETQLDEAINGNQGGLESGFGRGEADNVGAGGSETSISRSGGSGKTGTKQPTLFDGERSDHEVRGEESAVDGVSPGRGYSDGSDSAGGNGRDVSRPARGKTGSRGTKNDTGRRTNAGHERVDAVDKSSVSVDADLQSALDDFKDILHQFGKAGKNDLSLSLVGLNKEQIQLLPRLVSSGVKLGYQLIRKEIYDFKKWAEQMRSLIGGPLKQAIGYSDTDVNAFIREMWNSKFEMDGEVHTLAEWSAKLGAKKLKKQVSATLEEKRAQQMDAESIPVKIADEQNIDETLPYLLPQQREDVRLAEVQFFDESHQDREHGNGKGYLFTNGTGTGKTYTGLGIVKRFIKQGKNRILVVTPSQPKVTDWMRDAANLGIELRDLDTLSKERGTTATTEKGEGAVITTFANLRQNKALLEDTFDLIVYDESHRIMENKQGEATIGADVHFMITNRNENDALRRYSIINPKYQAWQKAQELYKKEMESSRLLTQHAGDNEIGAKGEQAKKRLEDAKAAMQSAEKEWIEEEGRLKLLVGDAVKTTKTVFLSATPFNTRESLSYTEGYIFSYPEENTKTVGSYHHHSPQTEFYLTHFGAGYKFRYGRLERSLTNADALVKQEIAFSDYLENELGTKSGRIIDSEYDYSRDFPMVTLDRAQDINDAIEGVWREDALHPLSDALRQVWFNYNYTSALLETMKISATIPRIRQHLKMGRKVVIFHRRVQSKAALNPPFRTMLGIAREQMRSESDAEKKKELRDAIALFEKRHEGLLWYEQTLDYSMPREQIAEAFGAENVLFFSGKESGKTKNKAVEAFNDDDSGKNIIVIQEASGKEGISLHDTSGKHQRVLITLALPQSPITALQIEGRIYRIGNRSNAIFEYPLLGLDSEMILFGQQFNQQVSTTENLALGSKARDLRSSFTRGVEEHTNVPLEQQGLGGKEFDKGKQEMADPYEDAVLDYYGNQKVRGRRDNREGMDYFATPEPVGFKMVEWAMPQEGESALEPSAGHGAIARYVSRDVSLTAIEPSNSLFGKLQLKAGGMGRKFVNDLFENYAFQNKHDVIVMNPPFGTAGKKAMDHLEKAFDHLTEGGRVVALIPRGQMDKRFEKWYGGKKEAVVTAEINLPPCTFEQAGTSVYARVVVLDRIGREETRRKAPQRRNIDLSGIKTVKELFERLKDVKVPGRTIDEVARNMKNAKKTVKEFKEIKGVDVIVDTHGIYAYRWNGRTLFSQKFDSESMANIPNEYARMHYWIEANGTANMENRTKEQIEVYVTGMKTLRNLAGKTHEQLMEESERGKNIFPAENTTGTDVSSEQRRSGDKYSYKEDRNTKTGEVMHLAIPLSKDLDRELYLQMAACAKRNGGYWNRFKKAFHFQTKEGADRFIKESATIGEDDNVRFRLPDNEGVNGNPAVEQAEIRAEVEELADTLHTPIRIVKSAEELPEEDVAHKRIENGDGIKGWFDIKSEEMAIYLPNATSVEDARESVFHEVVGHYGLRKLFGEDFNTFLDNVYANVSPEIRKQIVARAKEQGNILDLREATEEYLAALAERGFDSVEERTLWQKIKKAFIDMLRKAGVHLGFDLTDNELRYVLWRSYQNLESQSIMDRAADIDMQRRLRVGNFRENEAEREKSAENYERALRTVNEFAEKHVGAGNVFVIRSKEKLREQLEAKDFTPEAVDEVEKWMEEGHTKAFFDPNSHNPIFVLDTNISNEKLNSYLWHENTHKALRDLFKDKIDEEVLKVYDSFKVDENFEELDTYIRELYVGEAEETIREECIVHFFETLYNEYGEEVLGRNLLACKENIKNRLFKKIYNQILYGTEESTEPRERVGRNAYSGHEELSPKMEMRNANDEKNKSGRVQGETEKRFRTGEPTGEERRASEKVDKSTLSLNDSAFRMSKWKKIREAYQDGMISVKLMQDYLAQKTGKAIPEWMDVYLYENSKSGRSGYRMEQFHKKLYAPLMQEAGRLMQEDRNNGSSMEEAERLLDVYMKAKHGLEERNERMRREAMLKKINSIKDEDAKSVALQEMGESGIQDIAFSDESLEKFRVNLLLKDYSGLIGLAGKDENGNDKSMPEVERYAREAISTYEANHDTKKLWELVKDVSEYALKEEYEGGLIDKETYETIRDMYKYYIPLRGRNEKTAEDFFSYIERGASDTGFENVIKKAYGHTYESGNAFAYLAKMAETAIVQSEKNRVKQRLLWMARNYRDPSIMEIANVWYVKDSEGQWVEKVPELAGTEGEQKQAMIEFNQQMEELQKEGKAKRKLGKVDIGVPISTYQAQEHQVRVKENGREYVININADPRIAHAINGYGGNEGQLKILLDGIDWTVRNLAALNTSWNPEFAVGNIIRDLEYAAGSSFVKEGVRYAAKGAKNTVPAMAAMQRYFRGKQDMSNQMDKYLQEFFENGGETGFTHLSNLNLHEKRAKKMLKRASRGKELRTGENIINQANRFIEMIPRFTTYVASRESGKSIISSVNDAKNITVNFNRRGSGRMADWRTDGVVVSLATFMAPVLSRMQMFANASIQGTANYFGSAKNHPVRWASTTASVAAMGVLSAVISNMLGGDDEPRYEDIPEWVRHSNFTLFNGKNYFSLPLTMEYRPFYTLGESMAMVYLGKSDMKKAAKSVGMSMWDNWNPLSVELFKSGSPTPLLTPFYENLKDEDYKGSKITGRTSWNAYLPEYQRAKKGTGDVFMWVSEGLNDVTGGNKYERGWAQVNPSQLEHLVIGWSGGTGRAVSGLYEVIESTIAGEKPELERAPIVRRFYGKVTEENRYRRLKKEFKDKVTEANNLMKSLKRMQKDYENPLDYAARINEIYKDGEYEKAYNLIEDNKTLKDYEAYYNGSETQEDADDVMKSMIDILEEALDE